MNSVILSGSDSLHAVLWVDEHRSQLTVTVDSWPAWERVVDLAGAENVHTDVFGSFAFSSVRLGDATLLGPSLYFTDAGEVKQQSLEPPRYPELADAA